MTGSMYLVALMFGVIAGLRTFTAPAVVAWAAHFGHIDVSATWLAFAGSAWARWILTGLALLELVGDQLPSTPSRTVPWQFGGRLVAGAFCGAAVGAASRHALAGAVMGLFGATAGTLLGARGRGLLARWFKSDHQAAFFEDAVAIGGAVLIGIGAGA
jgi:uncharacterized membrane protein